MVGEHGCGAYASNGAHKLEGLLLSHVGYWLPLVLASLRVEAIGTSAEGGALPPSSWPLLGCAVDTVALCRAIHAEPPPRRPLYLGFGIRWVGCFVVREGGRDPTE